jgi:hypothetical protein
VQWTPAEVAVSVQQVLQCWCRLMQQQLQLAVTNSPAADAAPAGSDAPAAAGQGVALDADRLDTITCLLPLLDAASDASQYLGTTGPWRKQGHEVLLLLEQYVRTVLAQLPLDFDTDATGDQAAQQRRQQQPGGAAQAHDTPTSHAGLHAFLRTRMWVGRPGIVDAGRSRQLVRVLLQLLLVSGKQLQHVTGSDPVLKSSNQPLVPVLCIQHPCWRPAVSLDPCSSSCCRCCSPYVSGCRAAMRTTHLLSSATRASHCVSCGSHRSKRYSSSSSMQGLALWSLLRGLI